MAPAKQNDRKLIVQQNEISLAGCAVAEKEKHLSEERLYIDVNG